MTYMRIDTNKFWGWVVASVLVGLGIGLTIMFVQGSGRASEISKLKAQLTKQSAEASGTLSDLQARLANAEASVTDLTAKNSQLTSDLAAAQVAAPAAGTAGTSSSGTLSFVSRTVSPSTVATGHSITLTVKIKGTADKVRMQIVGTGYNKTIYLTRVSTSGGVQTWRKTVTAPTKKGVYNYFAGAYIGTKHSTMSGTRSFTVK
jgi:hypothetical protein